MTNRFRYVALLCMAVVGSAGGVAARDDAPLTVSRPRVTPPDIRSPLEPGAPIPWSGSPLLTPPDLSIVDQQTRFLSEGLAEERCPGDRVVFVPGVITPYRPTLPGDGAFMCRGDAIAQGFLGP